MKSTEFIKIRTRLLEGGDPANWPDAVRLGNGLYRTAYRVGDIVVKRHFSHIGLGSRNTDLTIKQKITLMKTGLIRFTPRVIIGGVWCVEDYVDTTRRDACFSVNYGKLKKVVPNYEFDLHLGNCGLDHHGRQVFFDY